ncbi:MAG TPA: tRNA (adenosine(37)-N6)-threonylcarbamoyltransferase complex dimerization subunit type 1 TsaB [Coleofasciculaceae cyanobacterium]
MINAIQPKPYALAIHTASPDLGLALSNFSAGNVSAATRHQSWALGRDLSTHLHLYLAEFLHPQHWSDLGFLAVAKGPGGFTGTRIGVVTARTLAQQLDIPLFTVSTLAAIAQTHRFASPLSTDLAVQMPAQRGEVHVAIYSADLQPLLTDQVMSQDQWQQTLSTWQAPYHLITAEAGLGATAPAVLHLAYRAWQSGDRPDWSEALPFYGQSPV